MLGIGMAPVARLVRPIPIEASPVLQVLVGVMPNFGAALALPFVIYVGIQIQYLSPAGRVYFPNFLYAATFTVLGLFVWEFLQFFIWGYAMDPLDGMATVSGSAFALLVHYLIEVGIQQNGGR